MFRLIKLALYVAIGYKLYEFFMGMDMSGGGGGNTGGGRRPQRQSGQRRGMSRQSHPQNMTGPGKGRRVEVDTGEDTGGHTEVVGRGVIR
jgi:hypothetical protein